MQIKRHNLLEICKFLVNVLGVLKPANVILQSQTVDMCTGCVVVGASIESLKNVRKDYC